MYNMYVCMYVCMYKLQLPYIVPPYENFRVCCLCGIS